MYARVHSSTVLVMNVPWILEYRYTTSKKSLSFVLCMCRVKLPQFFTCGRGFFFLCSWLYFFQFSTNNFIEHKLHSLKLLNPLFCFIINYILPYPEFETDYRSCPVRLFVENWNTFLEVEGSTSASPAHLQIMVDLLHTDG